MDVSTAARQLARAILEAEPPKGEDPRSFLKFHAPRGGPEAEKIPYDFEWEDIGIDNSQYFRGRGVAYTSWDVVYVGTGDNPAEAASDALDQVAYSWKITDEINNAAPDAETPSASAEVHEQIRNEAASEVDREDYETDEDYEAAVDEKAEEMLEMAESDLYYYVALYLREYDPELD
jgi:hypothetical protein